MSAYTECVFALCTRPRRALLPLCAEHAAYAWSVVEADRAASGQTPDVFDFERAKAERRQRRTEPGWLYIIALGDRIKIGWSANVDRRLASYPPGWVELARTPGTLNDESLLHGQFAQHRIAGREWYADAPEIRLYAESLQDPPTERIRPFLGAPPPPPGRR